MPWTPEDGPSRHTKKADTPAAKKQWSTVANKVLEDSGDEGKAVRIANAAVAKRKGVGLSKIPGE
jgi:uncharacterized protein YdaT